MKKRYFILSAILAYLVFLIALVPAAPVLALVQNYVPAFSVQGVSGSLWTGKAATISINHQHTLTSNSWQFNGWRLFLGELSLDLTSQYQQRLLSTELALQLSGQLTARDIKASISAATLAQLAQLPLAELGGEISLQFERLVWKASQVPRAIGILRWHNASITVAETADLGNVSIVLTEGVAQPVLARISNQGGQIKLDGEANVGEDGEYHAQLTMLPNSDASANIRNSLGMIAKPKPGGRYQIDHSGNLKQFGLM